MPSAVTGKVSSRPSAVTTVPALALTPVCVPVLARTTPAAAWDAASPKAVRQGAAQASYGKPGRGATRARHGIWGAEPHDVREHPGRDEVLAREPAGVDRVDPVMSTPWALRVLRTYAAASADPVGALGRKAACRVSDSVRA